MGARSDNLLGPSLMRPQVFFSFFQVEWPGGGVPLSQSEGHPGFAKVSDATGTVVSLKCDLPRFP